MEWKSGAFSQWATTLWGNREPKRNHTWEAREDEALVDSSTPCRRFMWVIKLVVLHVYFYGSRRSELTSQVVFCDGLTTYLLPDDKHPPICLILIRIKQQFIVIAGWSVVCICSASQKTTTVVVRVICNGSDRPSIEISLYNFDHPWIYCLITAA